MPVACSTARRVRPLASRAACRNAPNGFVCVVMLLSISSMAKCVKHCLIAPGCRAQIVRHCRHRGRWSTCYRAQRYAAQIRAPFVRRYREMGGQGITAGAHEWRSNTQWDLAPTSGKDICSLTPAFGPLVDDEVPRALYIWPPRLSTSWKLNALVAPNYRATTW